VSERVFETMATRFQMSISSRMKRRNEREFRKRPIDGGEVGIVEESAVVGHRERSERFTESLRSIQIGWA